MTAPANLGPVEKVPTGIPGFDRVSLGGIPRGRATLVTGTAGSGKSILAAQFLAYAIQERGEAGVFVPLEERPDDIRRNLAGFGWDVAAWEDQGLWRFVDGSPPADGDPVVVGEYDLRALVARVRHAVEQTGATRVSVDTLNVLYQRFEDQDAVRDLVRQLGRSLKDMGVTAVMTVERDEADGAPRSYTVEDFVAEAVIVLRNAFREQRRRRTVEILKFRGAPHQSGEVPFTIRSGRGLQVIPLWSKDMDYASTTERCSTGVPKLDEIFGGGLLGDTILLVAGPTGSGKTLYTLHYVLDAVRRGERALVASFEESRDHLVRNARSFGFDLAPYEEKGLLRITSAYPESRNLEDHLLKIQDEVEEMDPQRMTVDSLSALEHVASPRSFREFVIGLTDFVRRRSRGAVLTTSSPAFQWGGSISQIHLSTMTDAVMVLRYVELLGSTERALALLKMRGTDHDRHIHRFTIGEGGMHVHEPFQGVQGLLAGPLDIVDPDALAALLADGGPEPQGELDG